MAFEKGKSGNPAGRPREDIALKAAIDAKCSPEYFVDKMLEFVQYAPDANTKLKALTHLMETRYGKPRQQVEMDHSVEADALGALFDAMKSRSGAKP